MKWHLALGFLLVFPTPLFAPGVARAQQQLQVGTSQLQQGTVIPTTPAVISSEAQIFSPDSVHPLNLVVSENIYDSSGNVLLPAGSKIYGQLFPAPGGAEFIANSIVIHGYSYRIQAVSGILHDEKDPRETASGAIAGDATIGAAAGAFLGAMTGGVSTLGVLGGATTGVIVGNTTAPRVVILRPGETISVILQAPLQF
jgi:hypothetical protein